MRKKYLYSHIIINKVLWPYVRFCFFLLGEWSILITIVIGYRNRYIGGEKAFFMEKITTDMLMGDIVRNYDGAVEVLQECGMGCVGCPASQSEEIHADQR